MPSNGSDSLVITSSISTASPGGTWRWSTTTSVSKKEPVLAKLTIHHKTNMFIWDRGRYLLVDLEVIDLTQLPDLPFALQQRIRRQEQAKKDPAHRCLASLLQRGRTWRHLPQNLEPPLPQIPIHLHPPGPNRPLTVTLAAEVDPAVQERAQQLLVPVMGAILQVYQIFGVEHITTNISESENSRIKRNHRIQGRRGAETLEGILTTWWVFEEGFSKGVKAVLRREAVHFSSKWATQNFGRCLDWELVSEAEYHAVEGVDFLTSELAI